jgi:type I restriction enzyme, S subunit
VNRRPMGWTELAFTALVEVVSDGGRRIEQSAYKESGELPVVDQGQRLVGGYVDALSEAYEGPLPVIVFGDHTRRVKYVDFRFAVGAQGVKLLRPCAALGAKLLYYWLQIIDLPDKGYARHFQFLRNTTLPVPPLREQDRILAAVEQNLSDVDAGVASLERVLANVKRYRAAVLKAACEGRLVPTEAELARKEGREYESGDVLLRRILHERRARWEADQLAKMTAKGQVPRDDRWKAKYETPQAPSTSELPKVPEGWIRTCLGQITSLVTSGSRGWGDRYSDVGPLFIRAQDIKTDCLVRENIARVDLAGSEEGTRTRVKSGDLLVTITGANVTKTASVLMDLGEAYVSQHVGLVRPILTESSAFLHAWIVSPANGRRRLERVAYGAGKPGLNLDNLRELPVALPPLSEQRRILAEVERLLSVADEVERTCRAQLARAQRLRQSVLRHAFEGKLVPQDPNDEPASALLERMRSSQNTTELKKPRRPSAHRRSSDTEVDP